MSEAVIGPFGETADLQLSISANRRDTDLANGSSGDPLNRCIGDWADRRTGGCVHARLGGSANRSFRERAT